MQAGFNAGDEGGEFGDALAEGPDLEGELFEGMVGEQLGLFEFLEAVGVHGDGW